jgi:SPP1 family predicted phage head-tail adaptor
MEAGQLRHKIVIEQPIQVVDELGGRTPSWSPLTTAWASIEALSGRELAFARAYASTVDYKLTIRYQPGIRPEHRVTYNGEIFAINAVIDPNHCLITLHLFCTKVLVQGA